MASSDVLIETEELNEFLDSGAKLYIIDFTISPDPSVTQNDIRENYFANRIPGARFFPALNVRKKTSVIPMTLPKTEQFKEINQKLNIKSNNRLTVIYDQNGIYSSPRGWFMYQYFGKTNVRVLNGGLVKWQQEGRKTEQVQAERGESNSSETEFEFRKRKNFLIKFLDLANLVLSGESPEDRTTEIVDSREPNWFFGAPGTGGFPGGSVPTSINFHYEHLINPNQTLKQDFEIQDMLENAGIDSLGEKTKIVMWDIGVSSCLLIVAFAILDIWRWKLYDGSWIEYQNKQAQSQEAEEFESFTNTVFEDALQERYVSVFAEPPGTKKEVEELTKEQPLAPPRPAMQRTATQAKSKNEDINGNETCCIVQ